MGEPVKIMKAITHDDDGYVIRCDAIDHDGYIWLVPVWETNDKGSLRPVRMIRVEGERLQRPDADGDLILNHSIPATVLDGSALPPTGSPIIVIDNPGIELGSDSAH